MPGCREHSLSKLPSLCTHHAPQKLRLQTAVCTVYPSLVSSLVSLSMNALASDAWHSCVQHMAKHLTPDIRQSFLSRGRHVLLVREPLLMLVSHLCMEYSTR